MKLDFTLRIQFQITRFTRWPDFLIKRRETNKDRSPMWTCSTRDGETCTFFHSNRRSSSLKLFIDVGYAELEDMLLGQEVAWQSWPIAVILQRTTDGKYWEILAVAPRPAMARPDIPESPDPALYRRIARAWARAILNTSAPAIVWDVETTGLGPHDEIVSIAIQDTRGSTLLSSLIMPVHPERLLEIQRGVAPADITHITPERLYAECAPSFPDIYPQLAEAMSGKLWIVYNASFDPDLLRRNCARHKLPPPYHLSINDAMEHFAAFNGEWSNTFHSFAFKSLEDAAAILSIPTPNSHDALADVQTTLALIRAMAAQD